MRVQIRRLVLVPALLLSTLRLPAQSNFPDGRLDPTRNSATFAQPLHTLLTDQYIWTAGGATDSSEPHFFRVRFHVTAVPRAATLYIAGPREAHVYLNGHPLANFSTNVSAPINFRVFHADAAQALKPGDNTLAIEAIRGRGVSTDRPSSSALTQQLAYGAVLAAKIVPAGFGVEAPAIVNAGQNWRATMTRTARWQEPDFDDRSWPAAISLGTVEGYTDFFQWNADAGMYGWPGYMGMSEPLRTYPLQAQAVTQVYAGSSTLSNLGALTGPSAAPFSVSLPGTRAESEAPTLLLDFGREVSGRLLVESACDCVATLSLAYGESEIEAMSTGLTSGRNGGNILGTNLLEVPARGTARGPKSGFRYVRIAFLRGAPVTTFKSIRLEGIYYPVTYAGHFESSDPLLNRIWETGAYTAHLCMQDGIWDAIKRDRGRWAGDLDVAGGVILTAFGDSAQIEGTLHNLVPEGTGPVIVNGIPGYSAQWVMGLYNLYLHTADKNFLASEHDDLLRVLAGMDTVINSKGLIANPNKAWLFIDWAPGLNGDTPETRIATALQFIRAYTAAARLFGYLGDTANRAKYEARARTSREVAESTFRDAETGTFGRTWQTNSLAVLTVADPNNFKDPSIWNNVLSHVKQDSPADQSITPYFNAYVLDAMAALGHRREALDWMRQYWGGMLAEGATSFWEGYDLRWPKSNAHLSLQADNTSGYFVSLAHGWSSGPAAWLVQNILGVTPLEPGYSSVDVHPDLVDLAFAFGAIPTPHGLIRINVDKKRGIVLELPQGTAKATVRFIVPNPNYEVYVNGKISRCVDCLRSGPREQVRVIELDGTGHYEIVARNLPSGR